jgi:hypothetical protein
MGWVCMCLGVLYHRASGGMMGVVSMMRGEHDRGKPCHYYTTVYAASASIVVTGLAPVMSQRNYYLR